MITSEQRKQYLKKKYLLFNVLNLPFYIMITVLIKTWFILYFFDQMK